MNRTVLVTGASGFVGAHLALTLAERGWEVVAAGGSKSIPDEVTRNSKSSRNLDIRNIDACIDLISRLNPRAIVHAAALANPGRCQSNPELAWQTNLLGTAHLLSAAEKVPGTFPAFIFISSDMVFDAAGSAPAGGFEERERPPSPLSVYAQSKFEAESRVLDARLQGFVLRAALVYGRKIQQLEGFMSWMSEGLKGGHELRLFSDEFRTPVSASDIGLAISALLELPERERAKTLEAYDGNRILHVGGGDRVSRVALGEKVAAEFRLPSKHIISCLRDSVPSPTPRPHDVSLCSNKLIQTLGISPLGLEAGLELANDHSHI